MKPVSITAHYERKLNTGDYSSVTLSTWATVELEEGDTAEDALAYGMELCRDAVKDAAAPFRKNGQPVTTEEKFAGQPVTYGAVISPSEVMPGRATADDNLWK